MSIELQTSGSGTSLPLKATQMNLSSSTHEVTTNMERRLHAAVTSGSVKRLESVMKETSTDILQHVTHLKHTSIHIAARLGHLEIVEFIHSRCPTLFRKANSMGDTALHTAARAGHLDILKFLIDCAKNSSSPGAIERGRRAEAIDLLRKANRDGSTVIHEAVLNCHLDVVKLLMDEDPELLNTVNNAGESPLYLAVEVGKRDINVVKQILESPGVCCKGRNGRTALHAAVIHRRQDMAELLLGKNPGLVEEVDDNRRTPLHFASALGFLDSVKMLLKYDTSTTCFLDKFGSAPIHLAARFGRVDIIREIIKTQPDITELRDERGRNILHIAVESVQVDVVEYILKEKALEELLNGRDFDGNTPLHLAAISGSPCIVCLLLEHKRVDKISLNGKSETAIAIAKSKTDESNEPDEARLWVLSCLLREKWVSPYHDHDESVKFLSNKWRRLFLEDSAESLEKRSNSLLVVATLVATVTFAAGITLPGGNNEGGMARLQAFPEFLAFVVCDWIGFFFSVAAIFAFILLQFIPDKKIVYWMVLFAQFLISGALVCMTYAFTASLFLVAEIPEVLQQLQGAVSHVPMLALVVMACRFQYKWRFGGIKRRYRNFRHSTDEVSILFSYDS